MDKNQRAIADFLGSTFGQLKKLDNDIISGNRTLPNDRSERIKRELHNVLSSNGNHPQPPAQQLDVGSTFKAEPPQLIPLPDQEGGEIPISEIVEEMPQPQPQPVQFQPQPQPQPQPDPTGQLELNFEKVDVKQLYTMLHSIIKRLGRIEDILSNAYPDQK